MQCLILAGGLGTRIRQLTGDDIPKALIPVNGKPFLRHQLELLKKNGITNVVMSLGHLGEKIEEFCRAQSDLGLAFQFVHEGKDLMGTGGAIRFAMDHCQIQDFFFVLYGDSYLPIEFQPIIDVFKTTNSPAIMTVFRNQGQWDSSNVVFEEHPMRAPMGIVKLYQKKQDRKPSEEGFDFIDYGLSLWRKDWFLKNVATGQKADLATWFHQLSLTGKLLGYEVFERFYEVGSPQGVKDLENALRIV